MSKEVDGDLSQRRDQSADAWGWAAQQLAQATIDALSAHICVLDETGRIIAVNQRWRAFAQANPPVRGNVCEGADYLAVCDRAKGPEAAEAAAFAAGIRAVMHGERDKHEQAYSCHSPDVHRWFVGRVTRLASAKAGYVVVAHENITERKLDERERLAMVELLRLLNSAHDQHELLQQATQVLAHWSECEAVGIRLREGQDYPYYETRGFPQEFVQAENHLCSQDAQGKPLVDGQGNPVLECMCGNVLCGRFNPSKPFFTPHGTFWTNSTSELLARTTEADRQARTRNRCHGEGYESVMLVPLRVGRETLGLLQINDRRRNRFTPDMIRFLERAAHNLTLALAQRQAIATLRRSEAHNRHLVERLQHLFRELDHRVKNNLAAQYALVDRYAQASGDVPTLAQALKGKLLAMKVVHEIIAGAGWQAVELAQLLRDLACQFAPGGRRRDSLGIDGPAVRIEPRQAGPLAMVLQELFANCAKHGVYRRPQGQVRITWALRPAPDGRTGIVLQWAESGGAAAAEAPRGQGQGLSLIEGIARFELGGAARFYFEPGGFRCELQGMLDACAEPERAGGGKR